VSFVVDNSIALAWCFEDEQDGAIMALLDRVAESGAVAPQLWPIEALNGLLTAERRGRIDRAVGLRLAGFLHQLPIEIDEETASQSWTTTARLAEQHRLTAYDATYLELAIRRGIPLATRDTALIAAAGAVGIDLLPTRRP
jgi:predicted nucleic acid-binding protein